LNPKVLPFEENPHRHPHKLTQKNLRTTAPREYKKAIFIARVLLTTGLYDPADYLSRDDLRWRVYCLLEEFVARGNGAIRIDTFDGDCFYSVPFTNLFRN
jgi:hypothetical protein